MCLIRTGASVYRFQAGAWKLGGGVNVYGEEVLEKGSCGGYFLLPCLSLPTLGYDALGQATPKFSTLNPNSHFFN